ncbi:alpha/beta fold hydrolase [Microlunatus speluncae]|uniref:alpha/beta fold hydrolase n=1 Tax=Microlunatus speluncae TaxID=2594267 RepID=UPI0012664242|nr:alpha/beta fold hydrolase [Microlunatus speluncae]
MKPIMIILAALTLLPALTLTAATAVAEPAEPRSSLDWKPCPAGDDDKSGLECASLDVPVDWSKPEGRKITLQLGRLPSTDPEPEGSLLVAYGGPGGPGLAITRQTPESWDELRQRMDLITWDTRGYGQQFGGTSTGLDCNWSRNPIPNLPRDAAEFGRLARVNLGIAFACRSRDAEFFDHLSSADQARDMEAIRIALGETKLNFYGASYAGLYGQAYARLFPDRVRTLVLDGTFPHAVKDWDAELIAHAKRNETTIGRFFDWCGQDQTCALHGGNVERTWQRLVRKADRTPLVGTRGEETYHYNGTDLRGLALGLARQKDWTELADAIRDAGRGDASGFIPAKPQSPYPDIPTGITECTDIPRATTYGELTAAAKRVGRVAPNTGSVGTMVANTLQCVGWPTPLTNPPAPLPDGLPPLLGAGAWDEFDAIEPVLDQVPGSGSIFHDDSGHTLYQFNECARTLINRYVTDLEVPDRDTIC